MRFCILLPLLMVVAMSSVLQPQSDSAKQHPLLLAANKGEHTLGFIDPTAGRQIATVDVGGVTGHEVIATPDGQLAYVPIYGNSGVGLPGTDGSNMAVIDMASRKVVGNVDFGQGVRPHCPLMNPKEGCSTSPRRLDKSLTMIDPRTLKVVGKVPTGPQNRTCWRSRRDGHRGYSANVGAGKVSVLDLENRKASRSFLYRQKFSASRFPSTTNWSSLLTRPSRNLPSSTRPPTK